MAKVKPQISAQSGSSRTSTRTVKYQTSNEFTVVVKRSEAQYVTLCLELGVAGCGDSLEDALADTREAIESYVESMQADNLSPWRPAPVQVLHEFLAGESGESPTVPALKVLAYAETQPSRKLVKLLLQAGAEFDREGKGDHSIYRRVVGGIMLKVPVRIGQREL
jgi:predicted RNase H-like HicB family nuclease